MRNTETVQSIIRERGKRGLPLQIGCLAANTPARRFYEAIGGRVVDERLFDEDGVLLPEVVYEWMDIQALAQKQSPSQRKGIQYDDLSHGG